MLQDPRHPYTVGLMRCVPRGGVRKDHGRLDTIPGFMPNVGEELPGCVFAGRCLLAEARCVQEEPEPTRSAAAHTSRCHFHEQAQTLPREQARGARAARRRPHRRPLLRFDDLGKVFKQQGHDVHALVGVSAAIWPGETLGLVGESGAARRRWRGRCSGSCSPRGRGRARRQGSSRAPSASATSEDLRALQIVFQNPDSALNRRHPVRRILRRSLKKLAGMTGTTPRPGCTS